VFEGALLAKLVWAPHHSDRVLASQLPALIPYTVSFELPTAYPGVGWIAIPPEDTGFAYNDLESWIGARQTGSLPMRLSLWARATAQRLDSGLIILQTRQ
jgi:hypothetical protein